MAAAIEWNDPLTAFNGVIVFTPDLTGFNIVSASSAYAGSMIELGATIANPNSAYLYANNGNQIAAINTSTYTVSAPYSIPVTSLALVSPYSNETSSVNGSLPDQIDGDFYTDPSTCLPGASRQSLPSAVVPPDYYFTPVLTITSGNK
ncbi:MAG: hypothetical protein EAZ89_04980 [Bacteroidetes bacterium]|nr:MAG: hypothetical protein EAZ89_04980 [Bacteroidota bacterium]